MAVYVGGGALPAAYCVVTIGGELVLSSFSTHSKNYSIIDMNVEQVGLQNINYTITVQYNPSTFEPGNPNFLENTIDDLMKKGEKTVTIIFGYESHSPYSVSNSPIYVGHMLSFHTKTSQNYINYTMKATGKIADGYNELIKGKLSFDYKTNIKEFVESLNGNDALGEVYQKHINFKCQPNIGALIDFYGTESIPIKNVKNIPPQAGSTALTLAWKFIYEIKDPFTGEQKYLDSVYTFSVMSFLRCLVNKLNILCNSDEINSSNMKVFAGHQFTVACDFYQAGAGKYGTISIVDAMDTNNQEPTTYEFDYGHIDGGESPNRHNVLSWDCDYNNTAIFFSEEFAKSHQIQNNKTSSVEGSGALAITSGGTATTATDSNNSSSSNIIQNDISARSKIAEARETFYYPYTGKLTIIGNPETIDVCRKVINIVPRINGTEHHTAGKYLVTGVTHNINSSAFYTTIYDVIKVNKVTWSEGEYEQNVANQSNEYKNFILSEENLGQKDITG